MSVGERGVTTAEDVFERQRREFELAEKFSMYVTTISALVIITGSAVLLFG